MINVGCRAGLQLEKVSNFNISNRALNHKTIFNIFPFKVSIGIGPPTKDITGFRKKVNNIFSQYLSGLKVFGWLDSQTMAGWCIGGSSGGDHQWLEISGNRFWLKYWPTHKWLITTCACKRSCTHKTRATRKLTRIHSHAHQGWHCSKCCVPQLCGLSTIQSVSHFVVQSAKGSTLACPQLCKSSTDFCKRWVRW